MKIESVQKLVELSLWKRLLFAFFPLRFRKWSVIEVRKRRNGKIFKIGDDLLAIGGKIVSE